MSGREEERGGKGKAAEEGGAEECPSSTTAPLPAEAGDVAADRTFQYSPVRSAVPSRRKGAAACRDKRKTAILVLYCTSCFVPVCAVLLWTLDLVNIIILNRMVLENGTLLFEWWCNPPTTNIFKLRIFNYTNTEAYLNGTDKKLCLKELGPYVYRLNKRKVYVEFDEEEDGEIVSFQENRSFVFLPEMSPGASEDDLIMVPNMILLGVGSEMHDSYYIVKVALAAILKTLEVEPFIKLKIEDFFWGYYDTLFDLAKNVAPSLKDTSFDKFGVMVSVNGVSKDRMSVHTGLRNRSLMGVISKFNGKESLPYWNGHECNRVDGSEGSLFPLLALPEINFREAGQREDNASSVPRTPLSVFSFELCRKLPLEPTEEVETQGFPAIRFRPTVGVFDDAIKNPQHKCFCDPEQSVCPPSGVFNTTPCAYGGPIMISYPHFYLGDESLSKPFEGLNPVKELHEFTYDLQKVLGAPLGGTLRLQMNAMVRRAEGMWQLNMFSKNLILPILWFEMGIEEFPEEVKSMLRLATETSRQVQQVMRWASLVLSLVLLFVVAALAMKRSRTGRGRKGRGKEEVVRDHGGEQETMAFLETVGSFHH